MGVVMVRFITDLDSLYKTNISGLPVDGFCFSRSTRRRCHTKFPTTVRHVAKQPFMSPPYSSSEVATLTVHSTKSAFISAAKQVDFPAEQGHHRGKRTQGDRCGRDDTVYQLLLQRSVVCKTKLGWRPITPQARGGQHPLPQKHFIMPTGDLKWPAFFREFCKL